MIAAENRLSYRGPLLTVVVGMLIILAGATLFATEQREAHVQGGLPSSPTATNSIQVAQITVLDGDIDNDGNQDGIVAPLALLLAPVVVAPLGASVGFVAIVNLGLLLARCEPPKLASADWVLVLKRPG